MPAQKEQASKEANPIHRRQSANSLQMGVLDAALESEIGSSVQLAIANPAAARPDEILTLQRAAGNRATSNLLRSTGVGIIQPKLSVGPVGDRYEQDADRVANQVMNMPDPASTQRTIQRQVPDEEEIQTKPLSVSISQLVRRQEEEEELQGKRTENLQRQTMEGFDLDEGTESQIMALKGGGTPLPGDVGAFMEPRFGASFRGVRVHTGSDAAQLNRQVGAQAFTHGQDIFFGQGKYQPDSSTGRRLLAHELTHVVQQTGPKVQARASNRQAPIIARRPTRIAGSVIQRGWKQDWEDFFKQEKWVGGYKSAKTDMGKLPKEAFRDFFKGAKKALTPETENWQWYQNLKQQWANWKASTKGATGWKTAGKRTLSILGKAGSALGSSLLGPIWKVGKAIYNWKTGKSQENFKDWRHYIGLIKETRTRVPVTAEPKWLHYIPPVLSLVASVAGDLSGFVGWSSLVVGLIGLIPYCQPALGVSGILGLVALGLTGLRALINASLDGWRNFRLSYVYDLIKEQSNASTGVLTTRGQALARAYQATRGEYEITKGQYTADVISTGLGAMTAGIGSGVGKAIEGGSFSQGFFQGISPVEQAKGAMEAFGQSQMTQWSKVGETFTGVGTTPLAEYTGGQVGELTGERIKKEGTAPQRTHSKLDLSGAVTNINQLLKPPLSTTSGKLRSLMNPITGTWTLLKTGAHILRSVVNGFAWFVQVVKRFLAWSKKKLKGSRLDPTTWKDRWEGSKAQERARAFGEGAKKVFGKIKGAFGKIGRRGTVQTKREPSAAPPVQIRQASSHAVIQRQEDEVKSGQDEEKGETKGGQMDDETKSKLEDFASDNKAEKIAQALEDFADVFEETKSALQEGMDAQ